MLSSPVSKHSSQQASRRERNEFDHLTTAAIGILYFYNQINVWTNNTASSINLLHHITKLRHAGLQILCEERDTQKTKHAGQRGIKNV